MNTEQITEHIYIFLLRSSFTISTKILICISQDHHTVYNTVFVDVIDSPKTFNNYKLPTILVVILYFQIIIIMLGCLFDLTSTMNLYFYTRQDTLYNYILTRFTLTTFLSYYVIYVILIFLYNILNSMVVLLQ